jgi:phosphocarrier protein FPr/phosphocarrier protein
MVAARSGFRHHQPQRDAASGVRHGDTITLLASGDQAEEALEALADLIASGMGEGAPLPGCGGGGQRNRSRAAPATGDVPPASRRRPVGGGGLAA